MDLHNRIAKSTQEFDDLQKRRTELLAEAEECLVEMNRLQGEYRAFKEILDAKTSISKEEKSKKEPK